MDLHGSVALITGAASPIGAAVSARLAALGASVAVLDSRPDAVAHRIGASGGHVLALTADPDDPDSVRAAVGRLLTAWERIDIVVTGAGSRPVTSLRAGPAGWRAVPDTGLHRLVTVCEAVAGYLPDATRTGSRGVADLVVISAAVRPAGPVQVAAARAVEAFCDGLRQQLAGQSVRVEMVRAGPAVASAVGDVVGDVDKQVSEQITEQVLRLIGRPVQAVLTAGPAG